MTKVCVFGIDGGTLSLVQQWADELPTLRHFIQNGIYGEMKSTTPSLTCPAWASMFTGKNPGKLGMYDFLNHDGSLCNSLNYHNDSLWSILNRYGKSVGLLNVPITYPPQEIKGYTVCGLGAPETMRAKYTYPHSLSSELHKYRIIPNVMLYLYNQEQKCLKAISDVIQYRVEAAKYLQRNCPCDLFVCVFFVTDVVQHYFWRFMDKTHPRHEDRYEDVIKGVYRLVDCAIGEFLGDVNIVVSDHGFGACHGHFVINKWLESEGYLVLKNRQKSRMLCSLRDVVLSKLSPDMVSKVSRIIPSGLRAKMDTMGESRDRTLGSIDWDRTVAYAIGSSSGGIYVRDERMRHEITLKLEKLGFRCAYREELYQKDCKGSPPDIFIKLGSSPYYPLAFGDTVWQDTAISGSHTENGMFMMCGDGIKSQHVEGISIYDVMPTVLKVMGVPVPNDIDGRSLL